MFYKLCSWQWVICYIVTFITVPHLSQRRSCRQPEQQYNFVMMSCSHTLRHTSTIDRAVWVCDASVTRPSPSCEGLARKTIIYHLTQVSATNSKWERHASTSMFIVGRWIVLSTRFCSMNNRGPRLSSGVMLFVRTREVCSIWKYNQIFLPECKS